MAINSSSGNNIKKSIISANQNKICLYKIQEFYIFEDQMYFGMNLLKKYENILKNGLEDYVVDEFYYYRPEYLCKELYGTTDIWYLLLFVNDMSDEMEFCKKIIKIFPEETIEVLNKILNKEKELLATQETPKVLKKHFLKNLNETSINIMKDLDESIIDPIDDKKLSGGLSLLDGKWKKSSLYVNIGEYPNDDIISTDKKNWTNTGVSLNYNSAFNKDEKYFFNTKKRIYLEKDRLYWMFDSNTGYSNITIDDVGNPPGNTDDVISFYGLMFTVTVGNSLELLRLNSFHGHNHYNVNNLLTWSNEVPLHVYIDEIWNKTLYANNEDINMVNAQNLLLNYTDSLFTIDLREANMNQTEHFERLNVYPDIDSFIRENEVWIVDSTVANNFLSIYYDNNESCYTMRYLNERFNNSQDLCIMECATPATPDLLTIKTDDNEYRPPFIKFKINYESNIDPDKTELYFKIIRKHEKKNNYGTYVHEGNEPDIEYTLAPTDYHETNTNGKFVSSILTGVLNLKYSDYDLDNSILNRFHIMVCVRNKNSNDITHVEFKLKSIDILPCKILCEYDLSKSYENTVVTPFSVKKSGFYDFGFNFYYNNSEYPAKLLKNMYGEDDKSIQEAIRNNIPNNYGISFNPLLLNIGYVDEDDNPHIDIEGITDLSHIDFEKFNNVLYNQPCKIIEYDTKPTIEDYNPKVVNDYSLTFGVDNISDINLFKKKSYDDIRSVVDYYLDDYTFPSNYTMNFTLRLTNKSCGYTRYNGPVGIIFDSMDETSGLMLMFSLNKYIPLDTSVPELCSYDVNGRNMAIMRTGCYILNKETSSTSKPYPYLEDLQNLQYYKNEYTNVNFINEKNKLNRLLSCNVEDLLGDNPKSQSAMDKYDLNDVGIFKLKLIKNGSLIRLYKMKSDGKWDFANPILTSMNGSVTVDGVKNVKIPLNGKLRIRSLFNNRKTVVIDDYFVL